MGRGFGHRHPGIAHCGLWTRGVRKIGQIRTRYQTLIGKPALIGGELDAPCGFEPQLTESESVVLPLDDRASRSEARIYAGFASGSIG